MLLFTGPVDALRDAPWLAWHGSSTGCLLSPFLRYLAPDAPLAAELVTFPASIGELWLIGYLLVRGVRRGETARASCLARSSVVDSRILRSGRAAA